MSFAYFLAPPFQPQLAALGSQLADRPVGGTFLHYEISALSVPLLFLFKSNPLRRASIWILIQTDSHCIFF